jgi:RNA polymerase sigma-70 factor (ECF subfamily)
LTGQAQEDLQWVAAAQAGDVSAFDRIMQRYKRPMLDFAYRMTANPDAAADIAQEVFVRAWRGLDRYQPRPNAAFSTWLFQIARNACLDWRRRSRRDPLAGALDASTSFDLAGGESVEGSVIARETAAQIASAVQALPADQRMAVVLAEYGGLSQQEIAAVMRCSAKSVESRLYRARHALRQALAPLLGRGSESGGRAMWEARGAPGSAAPRPEADPPDSSEGFASEERYTWRNRQERGSDES